MIGSRTLARMLPAMLLLLCQVALAQPAVEEEPAAAATAAAPESAAGDNPATGDKASGTPARVERSPSDYRASEKISEDLPVSFPVDI